MGSVCCQTDIVSSAIDTNIPKITQYEESILPQNDGVLKEWIVQNNIQIQQNPTNQSGNAPKLKAMKHKEYNRYYYGTWNDGIPEGNALFYEPEKIIFTGHFHNGLPEGKANIKFIQEGCEFDGELKEGKAHGQGTIYNLKQKYNFRGIWQDSRPKEGVLTFSNDPNISNIQFSNFQKGKGVIIYKDNRRYEGKDVCYSGDISTSKLIPHGKGKVIFPFNSNKVFFEGDWVNGIMHGKGKFLWTDNSFYEGDYINGKKQGYGKFVFLNGNYYEGFWIAGKQRGVGTLYDKNKVELKKGKWVDGIYDSYLDPQTFLKQSQILQEQILKQKKQTQEELNKQSQVKKNSVFHNEKDSKNSKQSSSNSQRDKVPQGQTVHYSKQQSHLYGNQPSPYKTEDQSLKF